MQQSTVMTKGQTTLPKDLRTALYLHLWDRVWYRILDGGEVRLVRSRPVPHLPPTALAAEVAALPTR